MTFEPSVLTVFAAAMLTALATGLGALPFLFLQSLDRYWVSIANAVAGGLMFAATHSLVAEGVGMSPERLILGMLIGLAAIVAAKHWLDDADHLEFAALGGLDARCGLCFLVCRSRSLRFLPIWRLSTSRRFYPWDLASRRAR